LQKAFYTVSVALAALFPLLLLSQLALSASSMHSGSSRLALAFIAKKEAQLDFKHAVSQVLANSKGESAEEKLAATAANLGHAGRLLEAEYGRRGVSMETWAGVMAPGERQELAGEMVGRRAAIKCAACLGLSAGGAVDGLLFFNGTATAVSRRGESQLDGKSNSSAVRGQFVAGVPAIGASVFVDGVAGTFGAWEDGFD